MLDINVKQNKKRLTVFQLIEWPADPLNVEGVPFTYNALYEEQKFYRVSHELIGLSSYSLKVNH